MHVFKIFEQFIVLTRFYVYFWVKFCNEVEIILGKQAFFFCCNRFFICQKRQISITVVASLGLYLRFQGFKFFRKFFPYSFCDICDWVSTDFSFLTGWIGYGTQGIKSFEFIFLLSIEHPFVNTESRLV